MEIVFGVLLFAAVSFFVVRPLLRPVEPPSGEDPLLADLEARKEAKYREIRDTQLDHAAGKLSDEDFARQDAELRGEAIGILQQLDDVRGPGPDQPSGDSP